MHVYNIQNIIEHSRVMKSITQLWRETPIIIDDLPQRTVRSNIDLDKYLRNAAFR